MATFNFPERTINLNFQPSNVLIPVVVKDIDSYDDLKNSLDSIKILSQKNIPQYEVYNKDDVLVGSYVDFNTSLKESLISQAGTGYYQKRIDDYIYFDNVKNEKYPDYSFKYWLPIFKLPKENDYTPNIEVITDENKTRGERVSYIKIEYDTGYLSSEIKITQKGYFTEAYFLLVREGIDEESYGTGMDYGYRASYTGQEIPNAYITSGQNKYFSTINSGHIARIRLDDGGFNIYNCSDLSCEITRKLYCGYIHTNYDKSLVLLKYKGCNDVPDGYLDIHDAEIYNGNSFACGISCSCRMILLRNKKENSCIHITSPNINVCGFGYDDIAIITDPRPNSYNYHEIVIDDELDSSSMTESLLLPTWIEKNNYVSMYDVYHWGCKCYLTTVDASMSNISKVYEKAEGFSVDIPETFTIPSEELDNGSVSRLITFSAQNVHKVCMNYTDIDDIACICGSQTVITLDKSVTDDSYCTSYNQSIGSGLYKININEAPVNSPSISYLGASLTGYCGEYNVTSSPVTYVMVSDEFNSNSCNPGGGSSGCGTVSSGCGNIMIGSQKIQRVYVGDNYVDAIFIGDTRLL